MAEGRRLFGITGDWSTAALDPGVWYSTARAGGCRFKAAWVGGEGEIIDRLRSRGSSTIWHHGGLEHRRT